MSTEILFEEVQGSDRKNIRDFFKVTAGIFNCFDTEPYYTKRELWQYCHCVSCWVSYLYNSKYFQ